MKKILALFIIMIALFTAGCWDQIEIIDLALVIATAIDKGEKTSEQVVFTVQIANPRALIPGEGGGPSQAFWTITGKGKTIREATFQMAHRVPRRIFFGHNRVLVVGQEVARSGITPYLDRYYRSRQTRPSLYIVVAQGRAQEVLEVKMSTFQSSGLALINMFDLGNEQAVVPIMLTQFTYDLTLEKMGTVAPMVRVVNETSISAEDRRRGEIPKTLAVANLAVFNSEGRMVGEMNETETLGVLWIRNWPARRNIQVSCPVEGPNEPVSLELRNSTTRTKVEIGKDGIPRFEVLPQVMLDVAEHFGVSPGPDKIWYMNSLKKRANSRIETEIKAAVSKAQILNADVFEFGEEVRRQHPQEWSRLKNDWHYIFPNVEVTVKSRSKIGTRGLLVDTPDSKLKEQ